MKITKFLFTALFAVCLTLLSCSKDDNKIEDKGEAILLVTFGSSYDLPQATYTNVENQFTASYPDKEIRWSYTSYIIRNIWSDRGIDYESPIEALKKLKEEGYSKISVQSLHIIPGEEYNEVKDTIAYFVNKETASVTFGAPLLFTDKDMEDIADILIAKFKTQLDAGENIVLMGHGTPHEANDRYQRMQDIIASKTDAMFVGTVEGSGPTLDVVITKLSNRTSKKITLTPLMSVAGDHATNDMAGGYPTKDNEEYDESWNGKLTALGYDVNIVMKGLGDYDEAANLWLDHFNESR